MNGFFSWTRQPAFLRPAPPSFLPLLALVLCCSCARSPGSSDAPPARQPPPDPAVVRLQERVSRALAVCSLPEDIARRIAESARTEPISLLGRLEGALAEDPFFWRLVDKSHPLPASYIPEDLVDLEARSFRVNKPGMQLRGAAAASLEAMAAAAAADGIRLLVSSAYRSFASQRTIYERNVLQMGLAAADRESARPGHSQHQLGTAVDFGSIDDSFYGTAQERWLAANAGRFGWSLSYPKDGEAVTGYRWESWHYRYVGTAVSALIGEYFLGMQQCALEFLAAFAAVP